MEFTSTEEVKSAFGLEGNTVDELRSEVRRKVKEAHPDSNDGESPDGGELFFQLKDALNYLNGVKSGTIVPIASSGESRALETISKTLLQREEQRESERKEERVESALSSSIESSRSKITFRLRLPQIGFTTVAAVMSFVWFFPETLSDHPIVGGSFDALELSMFTPLWLMFLFITAFALFYTQRAVRAYVRFQERLSLESSQNTLFEAFRQKHILTEGNTFYKSTLAYFISIVIAEGNESALFTDLSNDIRSRLSTLQEPGILAFTRSHIDEGTIQDLSDLILTKAQSKGLIREIESSSLEEQYEFTDAHRGEHNST